MANIIISEKYLRALLDELSAYANELGDAEGYCNEEDRQSLETRIQQIGILVSVGERALAANKHGRVVKGQLEK